MKAKPFKATPPPNFSGSKTSDRIARAAMVAAVAARVPLPKHRDRRSFRCLISTAVHDAVKADKLHKVTAREFLVGEFGKWARARWPEGDFSDVPAFPLSGSASGMLPALRGTAMGYTHPSMLQAATKETLTLRRENHVLAQALAVAEGRVRELEPDALKWRNWIDSKKGKRRG